VAAANGAELRRIEPDPVTPAFLDGVVEVRVPAHSIATGVGVAGVVAAVSGNFS